MIRKALFVFICAISLCVPQSVPQAAFGIFQTSTVSTGAGCSDVPPVIAVGMGMNTCVFNDSMTSSSTFDLQGTNNADFNWYTQDVFCTIYFHATIAATVMTVVSVEARAGCDGVTAALVTPGMTIGQGGIPGIPTAGTTVVSNGSGTGLTGTYNISPSQTVSSSTPMTATFIQPAASLSFSASGLKMAGVGQAKGNYGIGTSAFLTSTTPAASSYHGISFKGNVARAYYTFDATKSVVCTGGSFNCRWPAYWSASFNGTASGADYVEFDMQDNLPAGGAVQNTSFLHEFNNSHGQADSNFPGTSSCTFHYDGVTFNTIDAIWLPSSFFGGVFGIWAVSVNADTCGGNAVVMAHQSGTTLTIDSVISGTVAANSYMGGNNVPANQKITSGSGTTWTVNGSATISSEIMIIANGNVCTYYPSASSGCTANPFTGVFAIPETSGDGMNLMLASGCASAVVSTPPTGSQCSGAGEWDLLVKNVQVWCTSSACMTVK